ncbi:ABC transporter permease [Lichenihabitans sp. Uapishka_5]|uniref:ABC transporter permease n=1 Tax=Lichenihabitans sp. Uapishka_5 TaxID=3037302 RepID=UPI0029E7DA53|nr:ABC transporter permease [Lichenihabitans sp. Uapishka_5]MDX7953770.1 ABC transporter permease [Lichenihabitans sp. Uapishka_5]
MNSVLASLKWQATASVLSNTSVLLILTALSWLVYHTLGDGFLSSYNLFTLSQLASETLLIGFSQLVVVVIGRLNLAVGGVGVAATMATGWLMASAGLPPAVALPTGLVFGALLGLVLGAIEVATGLGSFIVTLAMSSIYVGVVLVLSGGSAISTVPASVSDFSNDPLVTPSLSWLVVPALIAAAMLWLLYNRSVWGWRMLAVGANQRAAELSGVRVNATVLGSFALSGLLAASAGLMEMSRVAAALPSLGVGWVLSSLVVPILGGTALIGGAVSVTGALVAAVFIESIDSGLVSLNVPAYWQQFAEAIVLLAAVMADRALRRRPFRRPVAPSTTDGKAHHASV